MSALEWDELQIPVGLAFFLNSSERGLGGFYPSPAGATECTLDLAAWERLATAYPLLGAAEPDVEAVLLCRDSHASAGGVLHRPHRRLLRAGRPDADAVEGLRRRQ